MTENNKDWAQVIKDLVNEERMVKVGDAEFPVRRPDMEEIDSVYAEVTDETPYTEVFMKLALIALPDGLEEKEVKKLLFIDGMSNLNTPLKKTLMEFFGLDPKAANDAFEAGKEGALDESFLEQSPSESA